MTNRLIGNLRPEQIRSGVVRGPEGLFQRRARPHVFGEPVFDGELVPEDISPARPHRITWSAHQRLMAAAAADGVDTRWLEIRSAYRSVELQRQIWEYRLAERREARRAANLPPIAEAELERQQRKWTAKPGQSAHHTGFAVDLQLYSLGTRAGRRHAVYRWLARRARDFGFYPYLPEPWHWEYDPPGLVAQVAELRRRLAAGESRSTLGQLLCAPDVIPVAEPAKRVSLPSSRR